MRHIFALTLSVILLLGFAMVVHAQDTNISTDAALSNLLAQASALKAQIAAAKAAVTIQTIVFSNGVAVATNTTLAPVTAASFTSYLPMIQNIIETLGSIGAAILILARSLRKIIPDNLQTGSAGTLLKHFALEINPQKQLPVVVGDAVQAPATPSPTAAPTA